MNEDDDFNLKEEKVVKGNAEHEPAAGGEHTAGEHGGAAEDEAVHHSSGNHDTLP